MRGEALSQTAKVIQEAKADIVGLQEPKSPRGFNTESLANLLGWNHSANIRKGILLTTHEIVENFDGGIKVKLPSGQHAYVFSLNLPSNPYQLLGIRPKWHKHRDTPFIKTEVEAIEAAQKARGYLPCQSWHHSKTLPCMSCNPQALGVLRPTGCVLEPAFLSNQA